MMKFILIFLLICSNSYATTRQQAIAIYNNIIQANRIANPPKLLFSPDPSMNAMGNGKDITLFQGMLNNTNKDELAWDLGHELAHILLGHRASTHANEYAADKLGWELAKKAGYNMCRGKKIFYKLYQGTSESHPTAKSRLKALPSC